MSDAKTNQVFVVLVVDWRNLIDFRWLSKVTTELLSEFHWFRHRLLFVRRPIWVATVSYSNECLIVFILRKLILFMNSPFSSFNPMLKQTLGNISVCFESLQNAKSLVI